MPLPRDEDHSLLLIAALCLLVVAAPVAFGSVHSWAFFTICAVIMFLVGCFPNVLSMARHLPPGCRLGGIFIFSYLLFQVFSKPLGLFTTMDHVLLWVSNACLFLLCQLLPEKRVLVLVSVLIGLGAIQSLYGLYEVFSGQEMVLWRLKPDDYFGYATGTYINRNHFAGFLELILGLNLGLWIVAFKNRQKTLILVIGGVLFLNLVALIFSGSRMGSASFFMAVLICWIFLFRGNWKIWLGFMFIFISVASAAVYLGWPLLADRFLEFSDRWITLEGRLTAWKDSVALILAHPWTGVGLGNFQWHFPQFQSAILTQGWAHAHNDYLELMAELGIPVFAILCAVLLMIFMQQIRAMAAHAEYAYMPVMWGCAVSLMTYIFHSFTDFNFAIPANAMLWFLMLGIMMRLRLIAETRA